MDVITLLLEYLIAVNLIGFALMGIDKYKAKKRAFRIPEATLPSDPSDRSPAPCTL